MGYYNWANRQLESLLAKDPTYTRSKFPGQQLGLAKSLFNSQMPGTNDFYRKILGAQGNSIDAVGRTATDASQALSVIAGLQGQTDQAVGDFSLNQADWKKFGLSNLNDAYAANAAEDQNVYGDQVRKYGNEVAIRGAQAANKFAKRKALWNTVGGIANLGISAAGLVATGGASAAVGGAARAGMGAGMMGGLGR